MQQTLLLMIERTRESRDEHGARAAAAARALAQAQATLQQLESYRGDYLRRAPTVSGQAVTIDRLEAYQRFVSRLDDAIAVQRREAQLRSRGVAECQQRLAEVQRRLMAFETLAARHANERDRNARRHDQRDTDEAAARVARLRLGFQGI